MNWKMNNKWTSAVLYFLSSTNAEIRYMLYRFISRMLLGRMCGGSPGAGVYRDLEESSRTPEVARRIVEKKLLSEAHVQRYEFPNDFPPWFRRSEAFSARYMYRLSDVAGSTNSGVIWIPNLGVIQQSVGSLPRFYGPRRGVKESMLPTQRLVLPFPVIVAGRFSYYHWLLEVMPEILHAVDFYPNTRILIGNNPSEFIRSSLSFFLKNPEDHIIIATRPVRISNLILVPRWVNSGFISREDTNILRQKIINILPNSSKNVENLYISRRNSKNRPLSGEKELEDALRLRGFHIVYFEKLNFYEQMQRCASARFIVAPHGAGLSNMIAGNRPLHIHEILPCNLKNDCYARLAIQLGFTYSYTIADAADGKTLSIPIKEVLHQVDSFLSDENTSDNT